MQLRSLSTNNKQSAALCRLEILRQQNPSDVEVAIGPDELEGLDEASIQALYNQRVAEERARNAREVCCFFFAIPERLLNSQKSSLHWKSEPRNAWGQLNRVFTLGIHFGVPGPNLLDVVSLS